MKKQPQLCVHEVYESLQGESTRVGVRCVFVRLAGCNLRCRWCDTPGALTGGTPMSIDEVLAKVRKHDCPTVEVTGGEPLLQAGTPTLLARLADEFTTVLLETSGAVSIEPVDARVVRIVDVKCPGSGQSEQNRWNNMALLTPRDEVKFVLADRADYDWAKDVLGRYDLVSRCAVIFAPVHGELPPAELGGWILDDRLNVRLGLQLHKLIWPDAVDNV